MESLKGFSIAGISDVKKATEPRSMDSDKYSHGTILVIGGNANYRNAPLHAAFSAYSALAASRTGAGYVTIAGPEEVIRLALALSYGPVVRVLKGKSGDLETVKGVKHNTLIIGPGYDVPETQQNKKFVKSVIRFERDSGNVVIADASVLKFFKRDKDLFWKNLIITPHVGEYGKLTGTDLKNVPLREKIKSVVSFAKEHNCTVLLKGNTTIITDGKRIKLNKAKTPALAVQGTGDVLCGIIAGYASMHRDPFESAVAAAYVHAKIGDELYKKKGLHIIARDLTEALPDILKRFDRIK
ncbi:MAG: NAD(P)H-hydrate dehydratase [Candidatus Micrarchaeales archaeon]|nr:NAD(P)H-hydrate dehydratase [Candidatus Micrarchaeales archaeon]